MYIMGEDPVQSDPNQNHIIAALHNMECVIVHDLFLNETSKFAHVFLPGSSSLEKDGTFTSAERRIGRVRKVVEPLAGYQDWEVTVKLMNAMGYDVEYAHASEVLDELARLTPAYAGARSSFPEPTVSGPSCSLVLFQRASGLTSSILYS